ncbi:BAG family molecular chaperone regulator 3 [Apostasia shenzhenica]|uniref:BAG family molecular chaperone regulator 3 n=1 Tax=Apostasia shenzhenica TaxID=1088818 RepID=A0A2I0BE07_9ASPA|nr:BAG family molecular chaperone regulator 3 [Apostasia shenzhenica]
MVRSSPFGDGSGGTAADAAAEMEWEIRPGGMLVQKRVVRAVTPPPPMVRLRITFRDAKIEVSVGSQGTFLELKKVLEVETGLRPAEQRLIYKGKERENGEYLDRCGVKDRSKLVVVEDPLSRELRNIEMRRNAKLQSAARAISSLCLEVDKLAAQVKTIEKSISTGNKVPELQISGLIELFMRQAVKLDTIPAEGDASFQKTLQAERVQKCVEVLDVLEISNSRLKPVVVTTKWETFDPPSTTHWEFFD